MPQDNLQVNSQEENPDETAAVLSFATKLSEGLLPKQPQTQETGATSDLEEKPEVDIEAKLKDLRKELKATIKEEISGIKEIIKESLAEDDE